MIDEKLKNQILNIIFKFINKDECMIFLFGSFKKGRVNQSSDIDIGIICNEKLDPILVQRIKHELNEKVWTLREIDFIDFNSVNDIVFLKSALKEVDIWHKGKKLKINLENLKMP
jgi:predicted nucleotidyltransferase